MLDQFILIGFAAYRLASFLIEEDGPFNVFTKIRYLFGVREGEVTGFFPTLFSCYLCMTVWTTVGCYLLWQINPVIIVLLAAMTLALLINKHINE